MGLAVIDEIDLEAMLRRIVREELKAREPGAVIMTKAQLATYTGWSISTIGRKMKQGLPYTGSRGEHPRFLKADVDQWLSDTTVG